MQMFAEGAEALFPGQGKQIVGPFANEKKKRREEKECRKWRKVLSLTGRPGLHIHDFQFNSEEVEGGSTGEEKLNPCTWEKFTIS